MGTNGQWSYHGGREVDMPGGKVTVYGPSTPEARAAVARRIVACMNACEGIDTEVLEAATTGTSVAL